MFHQMITFRSHISTYFDNMSSVKDYWGSSADQCVENEWEYQLIKLLIATGDAHQHCYDPQSGKYTHV